MPDRSLREPSAARAARRNRSPQLPWCTFVTWCLRGVLPSRDNRATISVMVFRSVLRRLAVELTSRCEISQETSRMIARTPMHHSFKAAIASISILNP
jgi:hypothetical protein